MGSLDGVRVLELGQFIAAPYCGQLLADHGAEVIKVERPGTGDNMRQWGVAMRGGDSLWWPVIGRNKKSVALDLGTPEGRSLARRLALRSDVVLENFRPGTLERLGLDPAELMAERPSLIVARISGFGQTGPYRERAGFGSVAEAMGGLRYLTGEPGRPPVRVGLSVGDSLAGTFTAFGVLAALRVRERTGRGQLVDTGLTDAVVALLESVLSEYSATGHVRERSGSTLKGVAPSNIYPAAEDGWIVIGANADGPFRRLCAAMGRPEMADDPRYADHAARGRHQQELDGIIAAWTSRRRLEELVEALAEAGVPAGPVHSARDVAADPHFRERGTVLDVDTALGPLTMQGVVPKLAETPGSVRWAGPGLGEHTLEVLQGVLGLGRADVATLLESGVAGAPEGFAEASEGER